MTREKYEELINSIYEGNSHLSIVKQMTDRRREFYDQLFDEKYDTLKYIVEDCKKDISHFEYSVGQIEFYFISNAFPEFYDDYLYKKYPEGWKTERSAIKLQDIITKELMLWYDNNYEKSS